MKEEKFKRKKLLVDKKFQTKFILNVYIIIIILIILLGLLLLYLSSKEMSRSIYSKITTIKSTKEVLFPLFIKISFIVLIIGFAVAGFRFLVLSHKVAGPMLRFKRILKEFKNGDLTLEIRFRKKDELKDVAEIFSSAVKELNKKIKRIKLNNEEIEKILSQNKIGKKELKKILKLNNEIKSILSKFKL